MPVKIPSNLPARELLEKENIFVMSELRAAHQDIRPLKIAVLNLMPTKIQTETQILRLLGNTSLQVEITLLHMGTHESRNTPSDHLEAFYSTFDQVKTQRFDGLVITGAPVENLQFEEVDYWKELESILDWSTSHVFSTLHICWGAQAGLYHHYGVPKYPLEKKMFGVYHHEILEPQEHIVRGFDEDFPAPHSRHTGILREDVLNAGGLRLVAESPEAGVYLVVSEDGRRVFVTGHPEYDRLTLKAEYERDRTRGLSIEVPKDYFPNNDPAAKPGVTWKSHAHLLYANWLNYYVYQLTPYDLNQLPTSLI
ncbi:MAG TPA: homoserine O-succinyltransferase [Spirochaetia bacterium]|nr:homoserine O-succinyltransferase [Spirochaetia bacterium]